MPLRLSGKHFISRTSSRRPRGHRLLYGGAFPIFSLSEFAPDPNMVPTRYKPCINAKYTDTLIYLHAVPRRGRCSGQELHECRPPRRCRGYLPTIPTRIAFEKAILYERWGRRKSSAHLRQRRSWPGSRTPQFSGGGGDKAMCELPCMKNSTRGTSPGVV